MIMAMHMYLLFIYLLFVYEILLGFVIYSYPKKESVSLALPFTRLMQQK